jgi:hypothetical protein
VRAQIRIQKVVNLQVSVMLFARTRDHKPSKLAQRFGNSCHAVGARTRGSGHF